ncbi:leucine-rich repeat transmembrane protein FLRT1-like [Oenanthe melanoleuca]|uniref:leucine-rich repeat transmembrane protein FLRT1-like n=1 Tax=Oenanthe melanoleuca TaxID=2939378 RepID=UPI0024C12D65|nr:leucine-rich repeat transmembrane protein FLRT1-like [Oenanthe melanoleuca]
MAPPPPSLPVPPVPRAPRRGPPGLLTAVATITLLAIATRGGACPAVCRCSGGRVYCNDRGLTAVPEGLPPGATTLFLQNNRIGDAGIPARLGRLPALRVLYLYANALEQLPAHLPPALRELHLQENNVRGLCRRALARAPLLERLHLDDNSVSAAGIEEDAFAENRRLRLLFLSRNHLSSVPAGLPPALEELRLDDNRIHTIPLRAFEGLPALRRLVLDGNLLANQRMADDTFSRLGNLSELSLGRNALAAPPANLPRARLRRLSLAANAISHVPAGALARMRALERLDLSDNNLTTLPRGLFDDLGSLSHLGLRNNPWFCGCNLAWLRDWLRRRAPPRLEVRGLLCQAPARLRGLPVGELRGEMDACDSAAPAPAPAAGGGTGGGASPAVAAVSPAVAVSPGGAAAATPGLWVQAAPGGALRVRWPPAPPGASLRLSWLRPGGGAVTETLVRGERGEYVVRALQPRAPYRVCLAALEPPAAPPLCAQARAGAGDPPQAAPPGDAAPPALPPAAALGAAAAAAPLRAPEEGGIRTVYPPPPPPPPLPPPGVRGYRGGQVPHAPLAANGRRGNFQKSQRSPTNELPAPGGSTNGKARGRALLPASAGGGSGRGRAPLRAAANGKAATRGRSQ